MQQDFPAVTHSRSKGIFTSDGSWRQVSRIAVRAMGCAKSKSKSRSSSSEFQVQTVTGTAENESYRIHTDQRTRTATLVMDLSRFQGPDETTTSRSRVIMVRKTEQRTFASSKTGEEPKFETVTKETVETFQGGKTQRKVVEKKTDVLDRLPAEFRKSLTGEVNGTSAPLLKPGLFKDSTRSISSSPHRGVNKKEGRSESSTKTKKADDPETFAQEALERHNFYRQKHGVPPLKLNKKICQASDSWAKKLAVRGRAAHSQNPEYGENIYCSWSSDPNHDVNGQQPVENWYSEIKCHTFGREPKDLQSGHFTQVIWKESKELGIAKARGKDGHIFVVANYYPPGNFIGRYVENVLPLK